MKMSKKSESIHALVSGMVCFEADGLPNQSVLFSAYTMEIDEDGLITLYHRTRPIKWFSHPDKGRTWNTRHAGRVAFKQCRHSGYLVGTLYGKTVKSHRVIFKMIHGGLCPTQIDHENGIRHDNRLCNLIASSAEHNSKNMGLRSDNSSGVCGVSWAKWAGKSGMWRAEIGSGKNKVRLGYFRTLEDARFAREKAAKEFGYSERHGT